MYLDYVVGLELELGLVSGQVCFVVFVPFPDSFCQCVFSSLEFAPKVVVEMLEVENLGMEIDFETGFGIEIEAEHIEIDFVEYIGNIEGIESIVNIVNIEFVVVAGFAGFAEFVDNIERIEDIGIVVEIVVEIAEIAVAVVANSIDNTDNKDYNSCLWNWIVNNKIAIVEIVEIVVEYLMLWMMMLLLL